jgi:hypothetical protein
MGMVGSGGRPDFLWRATARRWCRADPTPRQLARSAGHVLLGDSDPPCLLGGSALGQAAHQS